MIDELKNIKNKYFDSSDSKIKSELRVRINELIRLLINYDNEQERNKIWAQILGRKNQMKMFAFDMTAAKGPFDKLRAGWPALPRKIGWG